MGDNARKQLAELCIEFRSARVCAGLTPAELAAAAGVTPQVVEAIESGHHRELGDCVAIAAVLGQRIAIVDASHTRPQASPALRSDADSVSGATVLQLPVRDRCNGAETDDDDDGLPGVW